jgi:high affinity Mn2+ porin
MNLEQQLADGLGMFARVGLASGNIEPYEFTDIDRTAAAGFVLYGRRWGEPDHTLGVAASSMAFQVFTKLFLMPVASGFWSATARYPIPVRRKFLRCITACPYSPGA